MRIIVGYGKQTVDANVQEYIADGYTPERARDLALNLARKYFRKKKPGKELLEHLS